MVSFCLTASVISRFVLHAMHRGIVCVRCIFGRDIAEGQGRGTRRKKLYMAGLFALVALRVLCGGLVMGGGISWNDGVGFESISRWQALLGT